MNVGVYNLLNEQNYPINIEYGYYDTDAILIITFSTIEDL